MSAKKDNNSSSEEKRKLTREELLAGKCSPEEMEIEDPRFKSPDELLLNLVTQRKPFEKTSLKSADLGVESDPQKQNGAAKKDLKNPEAPSPKSNGKAPQPDSTPSVNSLQEKYDRDIARWREYEQNVNHWKDRVLQIVQHLKKELAETQALKAEVGALNEVIRSKDTEISRLVSKQKKGSKKHKSS